MKKLLSLSAVLIGFSAMGCGASSSVEPTSHEDQHLDVTPASVGDAVAEIERADRLAANGADPTTLRAELTQLREHMDDLNGRVAKVDLAPGHVVNFYLGAAGSLVVNERSLKGMPSALATLDLSKLTAAELFLKLAPTRAVPEALLANPTAMLEPIASGEEQAAQLVPVPGEVSSARQLLPTVASGTETISRSQAALTAADGPFFRANFCPQQGVFFFCNPDWSGGLSAWAGATHSAFNVAPFAGGSVVTMFSMNGSGSGSFATFQGEVSSFLGMGPTFLVVDTGCCSICPTCRRHVEVRTTTHRWDVSAAGKSFHAGGRFLIDPRNTTFH